MPWPEPVARALAAAGWSAGRVTDITAAETTLARWGIPMHERARALLSELSGLECAPLEIDVERALFWLGPDDVAFLPSLIGEPLVPFAAHETGLLLLAPSGAAIALDGEWTAYTRYDSAGDALEHRLFPRAARHPITKIPAAERPPEHR